MLNFMDEKYMQRVVIHFMEISQQDGGCPSISRRIYVGLELNMCIPGVR